MFWEIVLNGSTYSIQPSFAFGHSPVQLKQYPPGHSEFIEHSIPLFAPPRQEPPA